MMHLRTDVQINYQDKVRKQILISKKNTCLCKNTAVSTNYEFAHIQSKSLSGL